MFDLDLLRPSEETEAKVFDPRSLLFPEALAAFEDETRHRALICGRGAAKTTTAQLWLISMATQYEDCAVVVMSNTAIRAKNITWPDFCRWNSEFELGGKPNQTTGIITYPNNARLMVTGADRPELFDRKRGIKNLVAVYFDECQDWEPGRLEYAATKVFAPRLGDVEGRYGIKGRMLFGGTGTKKLGFFYRICTDPSLGFGVHRWTQWQNPHIVDPQGEYEAACKLSGVDPKNPDELTRREWFGEFNDGASQLQIFKLRQDTLVPLSVVPRNDLRCVVAVDFGTIDACACAAWVYAPYDPHLYMVESQRQYGLSGSQQVKFARDFASHINATWKPRGRPIMTGDGGGLGKALVMDLVATEKAWEVEAAQKIDKIPNMRFMAGAIADGTVKIVETETEFLEDLKLPEWHPDHVGEKYRGHMPDSVDAGYLGYRKARELHFYKPVPVDPNRPTDPDELADYERDQKWKAVREAERKRRARGRF